MKTICLWMPTLPDTHNELLKLFDLIPVLHMKKTHISFFDLILLNLEIWMYIWFDNLSRWNENFNTLWYNVCAENHSANNEKLIIFVQWGYCKKKKSWWYCDDDRECIADCRKSILKLIWLIEKVTIIVGIKYKANNLVVTQFLAHYIFQQLTKCL